MSGNSDFLDIPQPRFYKSWTRAILAKLNKEFKVNMKSSVTDKVQGTAKEITGKVKEAAGRATNDPDLQDRGTVERAEGQLQKKVGDIKKVFGK